MAPGGGVGGDGPRRSKRAKRAAASGAREGAAGGAAGGGAPNREGGGGGRGRGEERQPRTGSRWITLLAVVLAAAVGAALVRAYLVRQGREPGEAAFDIVRTNVPAPEVTLTGPDGKSFPLRQSNGEVLFVNFWATWCPPCREEMPSMIQLGRDLARSHPGKFRMVAVSADESWDDVRRYFQQALGGTPSEITVARDPGGKAALAYYCSARGACPDVKLPESYIVDRSGRIVAYVVSSRDWGDPVARRFLERLIAR